MVIGPTSRPTTPITHTSMPPDNVQSVYLCLPTTPWHRPALQNNNTCCCYKRTKISVRTKTTPWLQCSLISALITWTLVLSVFCSSRESVSSRITCCLRIWEVQSKSADRRVSVHDMKTQYTPSSLARKRIYTELIGTPRLRHHHTEALRKPTDC